MWGHSLVPGGGSDAESYAVVDAVAPLLSAVGVAGRQAMNHLVRKAGHFSEYLVLGLAASGARVPFAGRGGAWAAAAPFALGVAVAACDETIQLFVEGRSGQLADVALDALGVAAGVAAAAAIRTWRARRRSRASGR